MSKTWVVPGYQVKNTTNNNNVDNDDVAGLDGWLLHPIIYLRLIFNHLLYILCLIIASTCWSFVVVVVVVFIFYLSLVLRLKTLEEETWRPLYLEILGNRNKTHTHRDSQRKMW